MNLLAVVTGEYGRRIARNVTDHCPADWNVSVWEAPTRFPIVIEDPLDFLPATLAPVELILALGEHPGIAELLPDIAKMTHARSLIAPVDRVEWLPKGLMNQLRGWMKQAGVACAFPKPFCSLTENAYSLRGQRVPYDDPWIAEFARWFGKPRVSVTVDPESKTLLSVQVERDAACGCTRFIAEGIIGTPVDDVEFQAGMLHHHYPCLASMGIDPDYSDTLLHVSGDLSRDAFSSAVKPFRTTRYLRPDGWVEDKDGQPLSE